MNTRLSSPACPSAIFSLGDPNGIGPEVLLRALDRLLPQVPLQATIAGDGRYLAQLHRDLGLSFDWARVEIVESTLAPDPPRWGRIERAAGLCAGQSLEQAIALCQERHCPLLVTPPVSKEALHEAGYRFPGQTEFIASHFPGTTPCMAFFSDRFHVALTTVHIPFHRILAELTADRLIEKGTHFIGALLKVCASTPRLAFAGLNPHASENGLFGDDEERIVTPAISALRDRFPDVDLSGPHPPDTVFLRASQGEFDGVMALYHDQGLIPLKLLAFDSAVNTTLGLPIVRTSPDHGTAFDIAGRHPADPSSMAAAIRWGLRLAYPASPVSPPPDTNSTSVDTPNPVGPR